RVAAEIASVTAERAKADADNPTAEIERARAAVATAETESTAAANEAAEAGTALEASRHASDEAREARAEAERVLNRIETEAKTLAMLAAVVLDGSSPMVDTVKVDPGFEAALGAAFGDDLDAPADEAAPAHWRTIGATDDAALPSGAV